MTILTVKTDNPKAELGLYAGPRQIGKIEWQAHRQLAETIHKKVDELLKGADMQLSDIGAIICFKGPGSFTGLRIGLSVSNALAYSLKIPVVCEAGEKWTQSGISDLLSGKNDHIALPEYDRPAITTVPTK